jgi:hypothetical protein
MVSEFNYDDADTPDEVVRGVGAQMSDSALKPLSPEEIALREIEREAQQELYRQQEERWRVQREQQEAAKLEAAQREAAIVAKAEREKAQRERAQEIDRLTTQRSLNALRLSAARQDTFRQNVLTANANAVRQQNISRILDDINTMANPPAAPEPTVVVVEADPQDDEFCGVKVTRPNPRRSWW